MIHLLDPSPDSVESESNIIDVGADNFSEQVIEKSTTVPVLIDFWAPWCEPCRSLTPILENLAGKYSAALRMVKINVDEQQELAMQFQVRSVPTVYLVKDATVVDFFMGAQPESVIREFLSKHIDLVEQEPAAQPTDPIQNLIDSGRNAEAIAALEQDDTNESRLRLARLFLKQGELDRVRSTLENLKDQSTVPEYREIAAKLHFAEVTASCESESDLQQQISNNENDWDACYRLASLSVSKEQFVEALELLLRIVRHDRSYNDDAARKGMVMVFDMLGDENALVSQYRSLLARILH